jgi:hypothetical protein
MPSEQDEEKKQVSVKWRRTRYFCAASPENPTFHRLLDRSRTTYCIANLLAFLRSASVSFLQFSAAAAELAAAGHL